MTERFAAWGRAIRRIDGERAVAEELYQGGYWSVVRELPVVAATMGWHPQLWISSAGYGVVKSTKRVVPYSATFAAGHADSVTKKPDDEVGLTRWWQCATSSRGRLGRSITSIAESDPRSTVLVLASPAYLMAMAKDLAASQDEFKGRGALFIVSSRLPGSEPVLENSWVPSRATLQDGLGGALVSLHARAARHLLTAVPPREFLKENISLMSTNLEDQVGGGTTRTPGSAMSDDEVVAFIRARLKAEPKATHTRLLRDLRESRRACEQGRFRRLFKQVKPAP